MRKTLSFTFWKALLKPQKCSSSTLLESSTLGAINHYRLMLSGVQVCIFPSCIITPPNNRDGTFLLTERGAWGITGVDPNSKAFTDWSYSWCLYFIIMHITAKCAIYNSGMFILQLYLTLSAQNKFHLEQQCWSVSFLTHFLISNWNKGHRSNGKH